MFGKNNPAPLVLFTDWKIRENIGKSREFPDLGSGGVWGVISIVNFKKRFARKLRIIILLQFWASNFRRTPRPLIFMFSDFWTCPRLPKPFILNFGDTDLLNIIQYKNPKSFSKISLLEISKSWKHIILFGLEEAGADKSWRSVLKILKILNMGLISSRKHETEILENLEDGINTFKKHEMAIL